jgi:hypothetical protein
MALDLKPRLRGMKGVWTWLSYNVADALARSGTGDVEPSISN